MSVEKFAEFSSYIALFALAVFLFSIWLMKRLVKRKIVSPWVAKSFVRQGILMVVMVCFGLLVVTYILEH